MRGLGDAVEIAMLRGPDWADEHHPIVGGSVWLDLPEMGAVGSAEVLAISACPPIPEVPMGYGLVTAVFRHSATQVWELRLADGSAPIVGTGGHPFWSWTRVKWVYLQDLQPGERVSTLLSETGSDNSL